jgi:predicted regulator of Ras-like GTPase activity (Roadblock/LC7/MglB family)
MSSEISETIRQALMNELARIEKRTDLRQLTILSRTGMKIATASSFEIDADPITASSAALIDVGIRFNNNVKHGDLKEILIRSLKGYSILMYIDNEYMTFAGLPNLARIGYYLEFLKIKCKNFSYILAGGKVTDELKTEIETEKKKTDAKKISKSDDKLPEFENDSSSAQDMNAMNDVLSFLNDWGGEEGKTPAAGEVNIGIDSDLMVGVDVAPASVGLPAEKPKSTGQDFPVYDDEVPPVPLEDVEALELGREKSIEYEETIVAAPAAPAPKSSVPKSSIPKSLSLDGAPDFNDFNANEYNDEDLGMNEDEAMFEALTDLGYVKDKDKDKEKDKSKKDK